MPYLGNEKPSIEDLEHYGVKGMKWGVRKQHLDKMEKSKKIFDRVAEGKGSTWDKVRVAGSQPIGRLATKGLKGSARKESQDIAAHTKRIRDGKEKVRDILIINRYLTAADLIRAGKDENRLAPGNPRKR